ncbi:cupin superfamily protein [Xylariaceae sp. AK1471]|nr:cupin superfamily protein [Xylariaceae sp. AK1471]
MPLLTVLAACVAFTSLFPIQSLAQCDDSFALSSTGLPSHPRYTAQEIISVLGLAPNVEGGYYFETFRDTAVIPSENRSVSTAIYYLLEGPNVPSVWHRVDAAEVWHWYAGAPLTLHVSRNDGTPTQSHLLGPDLFRNQRPQIVIPAGDWQQALSCGSWTLVGTTVAPAFVPEGYELAPPGWEPVGA